MRGQVPLMGDRLDAGRFQVIDHALRLIGAAGAVVVHDDIGAVGCQRFCEQFAQVGRSAGKATPGSATSHRPARTARSSRQSGGASASAPMDR